MDLVLIPGLWLDGSAWDAVLPGLRAAGHTPHPMTLPGQGDGSASATLDDQLDAVVAAIDAADGPVAVVGHSAGAALAWLAADRRAQRVAVVALIGGMPQADGQAYAPWFTPEGDVVPFPGWEPFAGRDSDDLDDATKQAVAAGAHPMPRSVVEGIVRYTDPARRAVPVVMVCPEYSPDEARAWLAAGEISELADVASLTFVDLDSGHWPMFSQPDALARVLTEAIPG